MDWGLVIYGGGVGIYFVIKIRAWGAVSSNLSQFFIEHIDIFATLRRFTLPIFQYLSKYFFVGLSLFP